MEMITIKLTDTSGKDFVLLNLYGWNGLPVVPFFFLRRAWHSFQFVFASCSARVLIWITGI